jgi:hypothetical protein
MAKPKKRWIYSPPKPAKPPVPDALKAEVEAKGQALIEELRAKIIKPPPEDLQFNYLIEVWCKWYRSYFISVEHTPVLARMRYRQHSKCALLGWSTSVIATLIWPTCVIPVNGGRCLPLYHWRKHSLCCVRNHISFRYKQG